MKVRVELDGRVLEYDKPPMRTGRFKALCGLCKVRYGCRRGGVLRAPWAGSRGSGDYLHRCNVLNDDLTRNRNLILRPAPEVTRA